MKKNKNFFVLFMLFVIMLSKPVFASDISVVIDDEKIDFSQYNANPYIDDGTTMLPFRSIFETFGGAIDTSNFGTNKTIVYTKHNDYDNNYDQVKLNQNNQTLEYNIYVSNHLARYTGTVRMKVDNKDGRIYLPIRAISEIFGYKVDWYENTKTVYVNTDIKKDILNSSQDDNTDN